MKAEPGTKAYGAPLFGGTVLCETDHCSSCATELLFFMPRPGVGSAVITLNCLEATPVEVKNEKLMFKLIRASFNQRRKNAAKRFDKQQ